MFDARFIHSPMGRVRSGKGGTGPGGMFDPRGIVFGSDATLAAIDMADETAAAAVSGELNKIENNQGLKNLDGLTQSGTSERFAASVAK